MPKIPTLFLVALLGNGAAFDPAGLATLNRLAALEQKVDALSSRVAKLDDRLAVAERENQTLSCESACQRDGLHCHLHSFDLQDCLSDAEDCVKGCASGPVP